MNREKEEGSMIVWFRVTVPSPRPGLSRGEHLVAVADGRVVSCSSVLLHAGLAWRPERAKFEGWGWKVEAMPKEIP